MRTRTPVKCAKHDRVRFLFEETPYTGTIVDIKGQHIEIEMAKDVVMTVFPEAITELIGRSHANSAVVDEAAEDMQHEIPIDDILAEAEMKRAQKN